MTPSLLTVAVLLAQVGPPGPPRPVQPATPSYFELLESNSHLIYPALGALVVLLIALGIFQAWRAQDLDGLRKAELKREVMIFLRRGRGGTTTEAVGKELGQAPLPMLRILEEMQKEGLVVAHTNTQRQMLWQLISAENRPSSAPPKKKRARSGR
jgi:hypothetical protein